MNENIIFCGGNGRRCDMESRCVKSYLDELTVKWNEFLEKPWHYLKNDKL